MGRDDQGGRGCEVVSRVEVCLLFRAGECVHMRTLKCSVYAVVQRWKSRIEARSFAPAFFASNTMVINGTGVPVYTGGRSGFG